MARHPDKRSFWLLLAQTPFYACAAAAYFLFALQFLHGWLKQIYESNRPLYAVVALALIVAQGVVLELFTRLAELFIRRKRK